MTLITLTPEQAKALCEGRPVTIQPSAKRFTCRPDNRWICTTHGNAKRDKAFIVDPLVINNYVYLGTEGEAIEFEALRKQMAIQFEFLKQHAPDYKPDWGDADEDKHYVYYMNPLKNWTYSIVNTTSHVGVYMPKAVAIKFCQMANAGLIEGLVP